MPIFSVKGCPWPFSWTMYTDIRETSGNAQDLAFDDTMTNYVQPKPHVKRHCCKNDSQTFIVVNAVNCPTYIEDTMLALRQEYESHVNSTAAGCVNRPAAASTRVLMSLSVGYDDNSCRKPRCSSMFFNSPRKYILISPSISQEIRSSTEWVTEAMLFWLNVIISAWASPLPRLSNGQTHRWRWLLIILSFPASPAREAVQQSVIKIEMVSSSQRVSCPFRSSSINRWTIIRERSGKLISDGSE